MSSSFPPLAQVQWPKTYRIIRSVFPPIDLFEDIADPADWELIARAEAKTNPRLAESIGSLDQVPVERRISGPGASLVMAPFVHCSPDRPSRFSDGGYGVYYAGDQPEVALFETMHHHGRLMARTAEPPGWTSGFRELIGSIDAQLHDVRGSGHNAMLNRDSYAEPQALAKELRHANADGIVYPSIWYAGGQCVAIFWPDVVTVPLQGRHFTYHWNGHQVDYIKDLTSRDVFAVEL